MTTATKPEPTPTTLVADRAKQVVGELLVPSLALITALVVGGVVIIFSNPDTLNAWSRFFADPVDALRGSWEIVRDSYKALFDSSLGDTTAVGRTLRETTPLLFGGLAVTLAFRAGLFNIGVAGQLLIGAAAAGYVGFTYDLPVAMHLPLAVLAGFAAGAAWGAIAGVIKARTGAHEVILTIMLNYVGLQLLAYLLSTDAFHRPGRDDPISPPVLESARFPKFSNDFPAHYGILLALAAAVGVWYLLNRTTLGFRMKAVGANPHAARYAGMGVGATYALAMALSGGLGGLAGTANILGVESYSLTRGYFFSTGFDGIAVALLGRASPAGTVGAAVLFGVLRAGATGMQVDTGTPVDIIVIIQALIIAFVAAPALIRVIWRVRAERVGRGQSFTTGWGG
ncbi:MAG: ABC transporter permease [Acidimicrobiales bacterium]